MDGKQLKNSILQWAIQGKLVPQNPKDEPAQKLLERIAASRNGDVSPWSEAIGSSKNSKKSLSTSLRGAKATKQSKALSSRIYRENGVWYEQIGTATPKDISDEIPFEIPKNRTWCRLKDYLDVRDGTHDSPKYYSSGIPFVTSKNLVNGQIDFSNVKYISQEDHEAFSARSKVDDNDILFAMIGSIGNPVLVKKTCDFSIKNVALFKPYNEETDMHYMLLYFQHIQTGLKKIAAGGVQSFISLNVFRNWLFPLPPLAEQKRIVAKLEQVLPLAEEYGAAQEQLDKLNKELPEALKKSILQEAIQGKLVPQNPKDEPAQILLERIAASRNGDVSPWSEAIGSSKNSKKSLSTSLRGAKATKQSKNPPSRIYRENDVWYEQIGTASPKDISDEIPFEIPETWAWCRLKDVVYNHGQKTPTESFSYIDIGSIDNKRQKLNDKENIIQASDAPSRARKIVKIDDILYSTVRPYLHNMCIIDREFSKEPIASTGFAVLACNECVVVKFLFYYLLSPKFDDYANDGDNAKGIAYPAINDEKLYKALIPIPPLAEQKRIVAKLEQLFKVL